MKIRQGMEQAYKEWDEKNRDPYGHAVFTYAERWAELMEKDIDESQDEQKAIIENAKKHSHEADTEGITGFMYGCAVKILSDCWQYGETLRIWHNKEYGYEGDGIVNPAIMTIRTK